MDSDAPASDAPVLVLGAGAWGTALALVLAGNGRRVLLWGRAPAHQRRLRQERENRKYLPGAIFPRCLEPVLELPDAVAREPRAVVVVVPSQALRGTLGLLAGRVRGRLQVCLACKGIERESLSLGHQVVADCLGDSASCLVLSGPSFARDVARGLPVAVTLAAGNLPAARRMAELFHGHRFRVYAHDDVSGVEIGGAVKNVIAIAAGLADGLELGASARAALVSRGLAEIVRLGEALDARRETFMGLSGLGDLVLTCTGDQSRNRSFGKALAGGMGVARARAEVGATLEGVDTARSVYDLARREGVSMPIVEQVVRLLDGEVAPRQALEMLLSRPPGLELNVLGYSD